MSHVPTAYFSLLYTVERKMLKKFSLGRLSCGEQPPCQLCPSQSLTVENLFIVCYSLNYDKDNCLVFDKEFLIRSDVISSRTKLPRRIG